MVDSSSMRRGGGGRFDCRGKPPFSLSQYFFHMLNEERTNRFHSHGDIENCSGSSHDFLNKSCLFFCGGGVQIMFCKKISFLPNKASVLTNTVFVVQVVHKFSFLNKSSFLSKSCFTNKPCFR